MKLLFGFLLICSFQLYSQSYLNILLSNGSYKNSKISELNKITFSENGEVIYFHLLDLTVPSENTANVARFLFSNIPQGEPLPVELSAFNAVQIGASVLLKWRTETEINNFGFNVERATDSNGSVFQWRKIGFVEGNGNSNSPKDYSFTDTPKTGSKYYYRLKQIDSDGKFEYSSILNIDLNIPNKLALEQNYPNPFNPTTSIKYNLPIDGNVILKVYDILGNEIKVLANEFKSAGTYTVEFNGDEFSSGVYIYRLQSGTFDQNKKMLILK